MSVLDHIHGLATQFSTVGATIYMYVSPFGTCRFSSETVEELSSALGTRRCRARELALIYEENLMSCIASGWLAGDDVSKYVL